MHQALPWIVLFSPLTAALLIALFTRGQRRLSAYLSVAAVAVSFLGSCLLFAGPDVQVAFPWIDFRPLLLINFGAEVNSLTRTMLIVVTFVGLLVHVYSVGYMEEDRDTARYFAGLSLFMFSMLGIVLADNLVMMFIFWELVGVSSYLLIGHWYERPQAAAAANKAFLVNRIGDFGFMIGILMLWSLSVNGQTDFRGLQETLTGYANQPGGLGHLSKHLTVATLLVFCGPMGKSAQVPLHVWLPDAMEGPTPVSALIHAATMVAAGVYLLVKLSFLLVLVPHASYVIACIGIVTSLMAALMATQQNDIKRILAYSTLSQLGYMICAVGAGASMAAMFHLFTHAYFKALLFLGAGAVIHAMHHEQDIWKMGGLARRLPVTFWTFLIATLALMGCPFFAGFYSKDAVIEGISRLSPTMGLIALLVAFLTAFYMTRLFVVVFLNKPMSAQVSHAHEVPPVMAWPLAILALPAIFAGWGFVARPFGFGNVHADAVVEHGGGWLLTLVPGLAIAAFLVGAALGFLTYSGRARDPVRIGLLRHKFYFDEFYAWLVRHTQDALAKASAWVDRWIIDGLGVRGLSGGIWGAGFALRFLQVGNLQAYAFFFGIGVLVLVYLAIL